MRRLLVTTALEETWGDGAPVLFLGEWCRLYNRKHIWSEMDALVAQPFGVELGKKLSDADYVDGLASQILTELTEALNKYHQVQHSERYWNIVLGHWLKRYVSVAFNRYYTLDQAMGDYKVIETVVFMGADYNLATSDSHDFIYACNDDQWNHIFYSRIMNFRGDIELNQALAPLEFADRFCFEQKKHGKPLFVMERLKKFSSVMASRGMSAVIFGLLGVIGTKFSRDTDAFIISSYLPIEEDFKLQLALGQVPQRWRSPPFKQTKMDPSQRSGLSFNYGHFQGFERYVRWQLSEVIPACYLEGYKNLTEIAEEMPWPIKPRFIYTSNNFDTDEIFKVWTALKVEEGIPYIVGQHGSHYGTHAWDGTWCCPERAASDKFITWGWAESKNNIIPAFVFTKAGRKPQQFDNHGGLLLIEAQMPQSIETYDGYYEYTLYIEEQFRIVESLPEHIRQKVTVRLHAGYKDMRFFDDLRWKDRCPNTKIDIGSCSIGKLIDQNRLVVYSYDSTGILETLALNIPMMCFFWGGLNHLLPGAKPYYELLADAGILLYSPEAAAKFIGSHWDDISGWWESKKVQDARLAFCEQYARTVAHPVQELKSILTGDL